MAEETGLQAEDIGGQVGRRQFVLQLPTGERVAADERYYLVRVTKSAISSGGWTALEREVMAAHRWWSPIELARTSETIYPENLLELLHSAASA